MSVFRNRSESKDALRRKVVRIVLLSAIAFTVLTVIIVTYRQVAAGIDPLSPPSSRETRQQAALPLATTKQDFFLPGTQPSTPEHPIVEIIDPTTCRSCHSAPIYNAWRGSMMSQSGRDPLFWAAFAVAMADAEEAGEYCLRCHAPRAWYAGRSEPADGSALTPEDIGAGVACEVCHRMVDPVPGATDEVAALDTTIRAALDSPPPTDHAGSGMLIIDPADNRRGPFSLPLLNYHSAFQARFQGQSDPVVNSRLCGSCHNVDNPLLSWNENPPGGGPAQYWPNELDTPAASFGNGDLFPMERTYDEWLNSAYAKGGVYAPQFAGAKQDGIVASCQDCHMARQTGYAAIPALGPIFRDCATTGCLPAHILVGGNTWVPQLLQDSRWRLTEPDDAAALSQTIIEARSMLARAASLTIEMSGTGSQKLVKVRVTNETGHKLPTGYPEGRRMWLNLRAFDAEGKLIYESAAYNPNTGQLSEDSAARVYEVKQGLTPELAALVGKTAGPTFHFALNNTTVKDNRIPPRGYTQAAFDKPGLRPVGATYADGQYWDDVSYTVPAATVRVVATLYYQTASGDYIEFLRQNGGADGQTLGMLWDDSKSPPEVVARDEFPEPNVNYIPLNRAP